MVRLKIAYWEFDFEAVCPTLDHDLLSQAHIYIIYGTKRLASDGPNPHPYPSFRMVGWVHSKKMKDQIIHHEKTLSGGRAVM